MIRRFAATGLALAMASLTAAPALAAQCGGDFNAFLSAFSREAAAQTISPQVIQTAFAGLTPDPRVIQLDQRQGVFKQTFEQFGPPRELIRQGWRVRQDLGKQASQVGARFEQAK